MARWQTEAGDDGLSGGDVADRSVSHTSAETFSRNDLRNRIQVRFYFARRSSAMNGNPAHVSPITSRTWRKRKRCTAERAGMGLGREVLENALTAMATAESNRRATPIKDAQQPPPAPRAARPHPRNRIPGTAANTARATATARPAFATRVYPEFADRRRDLPPANRSPSSRCRKSGKSAARALPLLKNPRSDPTTHT